MYYWKTFDEEIDVVSRIYPLEAVSRCRVFYPTPSVVSFKLLTSPPMMIRVIGLIP